MTKVATFCGSSPSTYNTGLGDWCHKRICYGEKGAVILQKKRSAQLQRKEALRILVHTSFRRRKRASEAGDSLSLSFSRRAVGSTLRSPELFSIEAHGGLPIGRASLPDRTRPSDRLFAHTVQRAVSECSLELCERGRIPEKIA